LRDKTLWRLLYETAARANEALSLDVDELDLPNRRAAIRGKNGELDYLHWQTGTGHLISRLVAGRTTGPVFLTARRASPGPAPAAVDTCPQTGRARLSYRRAQELFREATGGWTLHQLRYSALTHLAEANVGLPLLMAKSATPACARCRGTLAPASTPCSSSPPTTTQPAGDRKPGAPQTPTGVVRALSSPINLEPVYVVGSHESS
jgi:hypothetical protein